jgi:hypothetical protein
MQLLLLIGALCVWSRPHVVAQQPATDAGAGRRSTSIARGSNRCFSSNGLVVSTACNATNETPGRCAFSH